MEYRRTDMEKAFNVHQIAAFEEFCLAPCRSCRLGGISTFVGDWRMAGECLHWQFCGVSSPVLQRR
jgi:hypothetical protein